MPTLQFKGKNIIWNHHLSIPYHTLDEIEKLNYQLEKGKGASAPLSVRASAGLGTGNLIIEGDNLLALKALLPQYAGTAK
jgi:adenine-specific DNA-methyltransferase